MSSAFMICIALLYGLACLSFLSEGKFAWALVALSWGLGNALLAHISR